MKILLKNQITRKLTCIPQEMSVHEAKKIMQNNWFRHLPIKDAGGEYILGMISDRDLLRAHSENQTVSSLMSSPVKTYDIETPVKTIVHSMIESKVSAFLITQKGEIIGIVTSEDLLLLLSQVLTESHKTEMILSQYMASPLFQQSINMLNQAGI
ncbi:MAG: CBS domain-containing protein [Deltaproteobacteria bacterium]|nr:CBS domain-containing protein [Deltaproteobacteria bacterium]